MNDAFEHEVVLFNTALQLPEAERAVYLAGACGADDVLRGRLESVLAVEGAAKGFLEKPVSGGAEGESQGASEAGAFAVAKPGDTIGRYKLLQQIGEGGLRTPMARCSRRQPTFPLASSATSIGRAARKAMEGGAGVVGKATAGPSSERSMPSSNTWSGRPTSSTNDPAVP